MNAAPRLIKFFYQSLFLLTPFIFTTFNSELFELPKMYFVYILTILILASHLYYWSVKRAPLVRPSFLNFPMLLFLFSQIVATIISIDRHTSIFGYYSRLNGSLASTICYVLLFFILNCYLDHGLKEKIISVSLISGFLVALYGILEHFGIDEAIWIQDVRSRVFSTFGQPNWLAAYLCLLLPFSLNRLQKSRSRFLWAYHFSLSLTFYLCLLFTKSKTGLIAASVSLLVYLAFHLAPNPANSPAPRAYSKSVLVTIFIFALFSVLVNNPIKDRLFPVDTGNTISPTSTSPSTDNLLITPSEDIRKIVWQGTIELWKKYPLFGTGVETFAYSYYWTRPLAHNLTSEWDFLYNKAHNEYLNYLATTGALGFISYLAIIGSVLYLFYQANHHSLDSNHIAVACSFLSILITNLTGFTVVAISLYFFILPLFILPSSSSPPPPFQFHLPKFLFFSGLAFLLIRYPANYFLADVFYFQSQNSPDLRTSFEASRAALRLRPNEPNYLIRQADVASQIALELHAQENFLEADQYAKLALNYLDQANQSTPVDINLLKQTAQIYYLFAATDRQYFSRAVNTLKKAQTLAPTDAKICYILGKFYESASDWQNAQNYYSQAISLKPNYDHALFDLGRLYFDHQNYASASAAFSQVLKISPESTSSAQYLARIKALSNQTP
ncbi:MAG: O-antigen ligase family protein [Candidatus Shapirobacteria bacterium]|jgi:O-antigen ligase